MDQLVPTAPALTDSLKDYIALAIQVGDSAAIHRAMGSFTSHCSRKEQSLAFPEDDQHEV